jgi:hypothetical protein
MNAFTEACGHASANGESDELTHLVGRVAVMLDSLGVSLTKDGRISFESYQNPVLDEGLD